MKLYLLFTVLPLQKKVVTETFLEESARTTAVMETVKKNSNGDLLVELSASNGEYEMSITTLDCIEVAHLNTVDVEI